MACCRKLPRNHHHWVHFPPNSSSSRKITSSMGSLRHIAGTLLFMSWGNCYLANSCKLLPRNRRKCGIVWFLALEVLAALHDPCTMTVRARLAYPSEPLTHCKNTMQNDAQMMPTHEVQQSQNIVKNTKPMLHTTARRLETSLWDFTQRQGPAYPSITRPKHDTYINLYCCSLMWYSCDKDAHYHMHIKHD